MTRRPLIAGNWKMHLTHFEAIKLVQQLAYELAERDTDQAEVVLCPPFTSIRTVQTLIESDNYPFGLGAQNMHYEAEGALTGEVSGPMLKSLRVRYVIVGHSERRQLFGETDSDVNKKVKATFSHGLLPIMCCGENEQEREEGVTEQKVSDQVAAGLQGLPEDQVRAAVIAYEPIWAIGTGKTATPQDAQGIISFIRATVAKERGEEVADSIRILYGGSVKAGNARALLDQADIDGALVGGASLEASEFASIVKAAT